VGNQPDYPVEPRTRNTEIYGSKGCIKMRMGEYLMFSSLEQSYQVSVTRDDPFTAQALDMVSAIREDRQPWIGGQEGLRAQAIMAAFYESADKGKPVKVERES
jgi:predicted dehydrogenase